MRTVFYHDVFSLKLEVYITDLRIITIFKPGGRTLKTQVNIIPM